jgi:hypothetical protein
VFVGATINEGGPVRCTLSRFKRNPVEVDSLHAALKTIGATIVSSPRE